MSRALLPAAGLVAMIASSACAHAADATGLAAPIEQCIRANAAHVESAIADLNQAVDFLVGDLCASQIADEQAKQARINAEQQKARWAKLCAEQDAQKPSPDSKTADTNNLLCSSAKIGFLTEPSDDTGYTFYGAGAKPPAAVALASRLLLELRLSHLKSGTKN